MCVMIAKPFGSRIPVSHLAEGFRSNPHGAGVMYSDGKKLCLIKGFFTWKDFHQYTQHVNTAGFSAVFHMRWSTSGGVNEANCHPFQIDENHALAHNGSLPDYARFRNGFSDTFNLVNTTLKDIFRKDGELYKEPSFIKIFNSHIGDGNKICIMDKKGEITIFNSNLGNTQNLIWYSNFDYLPQKTNKKVLRQKFSTTKVKAFGEF